MNVRDIMETVFITVHEDATYKQVADLLYESKRGCVQSYYLNPEQYTDPKEREKKIEEVQDHPVKRFVCRDVHSATLEEPIMRAGATMLAKNIRRMPVIEEGKLVGVVTRRAIYRALYEKHLKT